MGSDPQADHTRQGSDWGGFFVRLAAWLLVFACVFAIFYGLTSQPGRRLPQPYTVPQEGPRRLTPPEPGGSTPQEPRYRYSV